MLTEKQINEIREHLDKSQNPLFFFDNDVDGLGSFLLLSRYAGKGKGVAIKSFPELDESYARKLYELNPDYIFVLDKPVISKGFVEEAKKMNLPLIWIDHHDVANPAPDYIQWYNPLMQDKASNEPVTYWSYKVSGRKEDLWMAVCGCIADNFMPDFVSEFEKQYPELWKKDVKTAFQALYETDIGLISRILGFGLKDRTSNVVRMMKYLLQVKSPQEILKDEARNHLMFRFKQVDSKYQKLVEKAKKFAGRGKMLYFQYGGDLSLSADIANELHYRYPSKVIMVAYLKGAKANISLRGKNIKQVTAKAVEGLEDATGGGHEHATGAKINIEDLEKFKDRVRELISS
jgi:single-stranded DNA-specific DHH superfamily exonuclease